MQLHHQVPAGRDFRLECVDCGHGMRIVAPSEAAPARFTATCPRCFGESVYAGSAVTPWPQAQH